MINLKNKVVAVTGAASGIGRELAINLAEEACSLALSDIDEEGLTETVTMIANDKVKVTSHIVDVADRERVYKWADEVGPDAHLIDLLCRLFPESFNTLLGRLSRPKSPDSTFFHEAQGLSIISGGNNATIRNN